MYQAPGIYKDKEDIFPQPKVDVDTGVPAFLGIVNTSDKNITVNVPQQLRLWSELETFFGQPASNSYLADAVKGFFQNGGRLCYVVGLKNSSLKALEDGLEALKELNAIDLVCAPDIMALSLQDINREEVRTKQLAILNHCHRFGDRFAILDSLPQADIPEVLEQKEGLTATHGALYYPWIRSQESGYLIPPCGHLAGIYARSDDRAGVHKAPANEILQGVLELEITLTDAQQSQLNPEGVNCLRVFPGRGIRVWGARTLNSNPNWRYINVQRLFLTVRRWIEQNMTVYLFESNNTELWANIRRDLTAYFNGLFTQGALKGRSPAEAFYVKCDEETNSAEVREIGKVVTEIGLAAAVPGEFIVVRILHGFN
ncbi:phage tail sheath subtilisin-like domain-containing protein [Pleurocapsa sp. PCC 7319]|uniref:phage tail sheath family protein n=1 Tax=Pleurocapsa sp. PCC 7319 TaxID=118161 RepID=UPI00034CD84A|nr:phage tail sheath subtilisin-like domain-containing protein [Pleurocapsa sp. PCC 7319]